MAENPFKIPTRDELIRNHERDYVALVPGAKVGPNTLPGADARILADHLTPLYAEGKRQAGEVSLEGLSGAVLEQEAEDLGLPRRLPAVGASGAVYARAAVGGVSLLLGAQIVNRATGKRYACAATDVYVDGEQIPLAGVDVGPDTNVEPGTILEWVSAPPGLDPTAVVVEQADGTGLSGGAIEEADPGIRDRIRAAEANPALAGNDADYRAAALKTPGVSVEAVWTWPCILGPGTIGLGFTVRKTSPTASRIPNAVQIAAVRAHVIGQFPKDDSVRMIVFVPELVSVFMRVRWKANGWTDPTPWPTYGADHYVVAGAPTATAFTVSTTAGTFGQPRVGGTLALFDSVAGVFRRKRILSFSGTGPSWDIVVDTSLAASDTSYTPAVGDAVMPWSDSLDDVAAKAVEFFAGLGPGEMVASFFDEGGVRQKRTPPSTGGAYPKDITGRVFAPLFATASVEDANVVEPALPFAPSIGIPGVSARLLVLDDLAVYPL